MRSAILVAGLAACASAAPTAAVAGKAGASCAAIARDLAGAYRDPDPDHSVEGTALQIFGTTSNIGPVEHNASAETMSGFVKSYGTNRGESIMDCFAPEHVPVISTLAMEFAVFDHFFAAVPGPTCVAVHRTRRHVCRPGPCAPSSPSTRCDARCGRRPRPHAHPLAPTAGSPTACSA